MGEGRGNNKSEEVTFGTLPRTKTKVLHGATG